MVNGVHREVPRPKPLGPQATMVFGRKAFPYSVILSASRTSKDGYGLPREYHGQVCPSLDKH